MAKKNNKQYLTGAEFRVLLENHKIIKARAKISDFHFVMNGNTYLLTDNTTIEDLGLTDDSIVRFGIPNDK